MLTLPCKTDNHKFLICRIASANQISKTVKHNVPQHIQESTFDIYINLHDGASCMVIKWFAWHFKVLDLDPTPSQPTLFVSSLRHWQFEWSLDHFYQSVPFHGGGLDVVAVWSMCWAGKSLNSTPALLWWRPCGVMASWDAVI
jgi:hypothetical protein